MLQFSRLLILSGLLLAAAPSLFGVKTGQAAPDFALPTFDGKETRLSDLRGRWVVIEWFDPQCPFVQKFYTKDNMQAWQRQLRSQGIVWLSIYSTHPSHPDYLGGAERDRIVRRMQSAASAMLEDADGSVARAYNATMTPQVFVLDPQGTIVYQGAIDNVKTDKQEDIAQARNYLLNAIDATRSSRPIAPGTTKPYGCAIGFAPTAAE